MNNFTLLFIYEFLIYWATVGGGLLTLWFPFHWLSRFDEYDIGSNYSGSKSGFKGWINKMKQDGNPFPKFSAYFVLILYIILASILVGSPMQLIEQEN
tara:strand:- start:519 stop:812 length:294 start_codon:yes stop_codon:yes gene_type:complete